MSVVECKGLRKTYTNFELKDIDFKIEPGCVLGVIGENGAGKTTIINLLLNKISLDGGGINILGMSPDENEIELKNKMGVVLDRSYFPPKFYLSDIEGIMKCIYTEWSSEEFKACTEFFKLPSNIRIGEFSKGMQRKLDLAVAFSHNAEVFIFDELASGLDLVCQNEVFELINKMAKERQKSFLISTHSVEELVQVVDDILLISNGRMVACDKKTNLLENYFITEIPGSEWDSVYGSYSHQVSNFYVEGESVVVLLNSESIKQKYAHLTLRKAQIREVILMKLKNSF